MALDLKQNFASAQYLENKLTEFDQTLYLLHIIFTHYTRVVALGLRQNFVFAQYL